jgi:dinuclear metal center YbgI/SA1388 family protein
VTDLVLALDATFPFSWADAWDRVGLIVGDGAASVTGVLVTLDATAEAVQRTASVGANVLVTHHPPYLDAPDPPAFGPGPAGTLTAALRFGVAVISLHTNLDRSPAGAEALPRVLGLDPLEPLESGVEEVSIVVAYAPREAEAAIRQAMASAGAGRIGEYEQCAFVGDGSGHFVAREQARPVTEARATGVAECRIEMGCPRASTALVLEAARRAHPYEEPVLFASEAVRARGAARYGRLCSWPEAGTLDGLARHVAHVLGAPVRAWGEGSRAIGRVATANGSGSSLLRSACALADVLVTGEVRYHDALDAVSRGLAIIEAGHDATEWPLVSVLAAAARETVPTTVRVTEERPTRMWHTVEGRG